MIIFLLEFLLALALTAPLALALRRPKHLVTAREAALTLHRAQLAELARDAASGRINQTELSGARLEIERRLLTADQLGAEAQGGNANPLLIAALIALPIAAFALYLPASTPAVPSEPHAEWQTQQQADQAKLTQFIAMLRAHLATTDPNSQDASQGEAYLAEALSEQAGQITPEALALFKASLVNAPATSSWRTLDEQRIAEASAASSQ
jgi:cytochrome c-type biogenesis protein CcmH